MVDHVVNVVLIESVITGPSIGEDIRSALGVAANVTLERIALRVRYMNEPDLGAMTIQQSHHDCFSGPARARDLGLLAFVHVSSEATDKSFVCFHFRTIEHVQRLILHREPDSVIHEPCGFLRHAYAARNFITADSILAVGDQQHCCQPLI